MLWNVLKDNKNIKVCDVSNVQTQNKEVSKAKTHDWKWIDGFKGTDENMVCLGHQYIIGDKNVFDGIPELGKHGFHFSSSLQGCWFNYPIFGKNRFFKVRGLVDMKSHLEYINKSPSLFNLYQSWFDLYPKDIFSAKEIEFVAELDFGDMIDEISNKYKLIAKKEDLKYSDYQKFLEHKLSVTMESYGFSDSFIAVMKDKLKNDKDRENAVKMTEAFYDEHLSKEMAVYLLLTQSQNVNV